MVRCTKCIIPDSFPEISFVDGLCSFCRESNVQYRKKPLEGKEKLREAITSKCSDKYDCIVPVSGGKDSSFILFYLIKELGLKPLALFINSEFQIDLSIKNVKNMCRRLKADLIIAYPTRYRKKAVFEALTCSNLREGGICSDCDIILRSTTINVARNLGIHTAVWGATKYEDGITKYYSGWNEKSLSKEYGSKKTIREWIKKGYKAAQKNVVAPWTLLNMFRYLVYSSLMKYELRLSGITNWLNPLGEFSFKQDEVQILYFFDYIQYNPLKQVQVLKRELAWETPTNQDTRFDCALACFPNYGFFRKTGITKNGFIKATLVRNKLINREKALKDELLEKKDLKRIAEDTMKDLKEKLQTC